jgi:hypothetical protein
MDYKQLFKDIVTLNTKSLNSRLCKLMAIVKRATILPLRKNFGNGKDIKQIPIIINNRNRYTYLVQLITWLEKNGYSNIYIIDNDSTYPKLLDYYATTKHTIFRLKENVGNYSLWRTGIYKQFINDYYIYTDPDVLPIEECPGDAIEVFMNLLKKYKGVEKVGFGLKIDDLPDHYADKEKVLVWEKKFWEKQIEKDLYDAEIDTTFAVYRPYANRGIWVPSAYRTGGKYIMYHLPWYENTTNPTEEDSYYKSHVRPGISHWTHLKKETGFEPK